jgi:type VI secretion system secreted protein Hcp
MAAVDYFLKIDGIPGESTDHKHKDEIDVSSWSWGVTQSGTHAYGGGGGAGKSAHGDLHFTMRISKASPKLHLACATGEHIKKAVLTCRKAGKEQQEYLKVTFTDVLVSSYQASGSEREIVPVEQCALNFAKIEFSYQTQKSDGTLEGAVKSAYDVKAAKAS